MGLPELKQSPTTSVLSSKKMLGEVLVELGYLTAQQVELAVKRGVAKKMRMGELVVIENLITEEQLARALAYQFELEFIDLTNFSPDPAALKIIPDKIARNTQLLPLSLTDGVAVFAVSDPTQFVKFDSFRKSLNLVCVVKVAAKGQLLTAMDTCYSGAHSVEKIVEHLAKHTAPKQVTATTGLIIASSTTQSKDPSVEALVNKIVDRAMNERASDIHIDPSEGRVRVRYRIDGVLHDIHTYPAEVHATITSRLKVLAGLDISEKRNSQDGRFLHTSGARTIDIRVSTLPTIRGEKIVLRLLDRDKLRQTFSEIGMATDIGAELNKLLLRPYGLIFVTGPTGSGKTTSLYTMLGQMDGNEQNIITVEDPVEFKFDGINQVQVNEKAGVGFAGVLRNILRQDPDVIMVGEVRDRETADIAVRAALTGHLVLSTLHTNDSISTPARLIDMGVEPFLISSALVGVLSQRLVRVLCTECRQRRGISEHELNMLGSKSLAAGSSIYSPVGCEACHHSGYKNRIPLFELMPVDETVQKMIVERASEADIAAYLDKNGFVSMRQDGLFKIASGMTSVDEVLKATF